MISANQLGEGFALNLRIVQRQTRGLSHSDSLIQPPVRGNCLNWVLGHLAVNRDRVITLLGSEPLLTDEQRSLYESESNPITSETDNPLELGSLLAILERGQDLIDRRIADLPEAKLNHSPEGSKTSQTLGQILFGLYFHDTFHTGQTELLRQLAGTDDKVI